MRADIVPDAVFSDYELPDHRGKHRTLSELQQGGPLVLVLSRAGNERVPLGRRCALAVSLGPRAQTAEGPRHRAEQRTTWAKGEKANFFPYGKTQAQLLAEQD